MIIGAGDAGAAIIKRESPEQSGYEKSLLSD